MPVRLLLVDDDDNYLDLLVALLGVDDQFEILGRAHNGAEAVGLAAALAPDVVVMDIDMPVMGGLEATRLIHERHSSMGIVLVSGSQYAEGAFTLLDLIKVDDVSYPYLTKTRVPIELENSILSAAIEADPYSTQTSSRFASASDSCSVGLGGQRSLWTWRDL